MSSLLVAIALLSGDGLARAANQRELPPAPYTASYPVEGERWRNLAIEIYPLSFAIGRFGIGVEYMVSPHHDLTFAPHIAYAPLGKSDLLDGIGAELGYRYFFSPTASPVGFFVGGAVSFGHYHYRDYADAPCMTLPCATLVTSTDQLRMGAALEAGWQTLVGPLLLGAGAGAEYRYETDSFAFEPSSAEMLNLIIGRGFRPRVFVTVGAAF